MGEDRGMLSRGYGLGLCALLLLVACGAEPGPGAVLEAWLGHLVRGELEEAFELLCSSSQRTLAEAESAWIAGGDHPLAPGDAPTGPVDGPAGLLLFQRLVAGPGFYGVPPLPTDAPDRVESEIIEGNIARVRVRTADRSHEARLVQEDGSWRVSVLP